MTDNEKRDALDDPTGGPSAQSAPGSRDQRDDAVDPSVGAKGQDEEGAVEEAREEEGAPNVNPG
ncbi:MAG: hypothetical protein M3174_08250 [Actinomycetota bacterium]|nr:hypothetical protein [Actinomycetota bacterium]